MLGTRVGGWCLCAALVVLYICYYITVARLRLSGECPGEWSMGVLLGWESVAFRWGW